MRRLIAACLLLLAAALFAHPAQGQQLHIYCQNAKTPAPIICSASTQPAFTGTGDTPALAFGKTESNLSLLDSTFGLYSTPSAVHFPGTASAVTSITAPILNGTTAVQVNSIPVPSYPRTAAEISAAVTPVDYTQPAGTVTRYELNTTPGTTDMTAGVTAAAASNGVVLFPAASYNIASTPTVPAAVVLVAQPGATFSGSGATALGLLSGGGLGQYAVPTASNSSAQGLYARKLANFSGGTNGVTSSTIQGRADISAGDKNYEWVGLFDLRNSSTSADGSQNVALVRNAVKSSTGRTWAGNDVLTDSLANPTTTSVVDELDLYGNGGDSAPGRVILDLFALTCNACSAATIGYGERIGTISATLGTGLLTYGTISSAAIANTSTSSGEFILDTGTSVTGIELAGTYSTAALTIGPPGSSGTQNILGYTSGHGGASPDEAIQFSSGTASIYNGTITLKGATVTTAAALASTGTVSDGFQLSGTYSEAAIKTTGTGVGVQLLDTGSSAIGIQLSGTYSTAPLALGQPGSVGTPTQLFYSSGHGGATPDVGLVASGGSGTAYRGNLQVQALTLQIPTTTVAIIGTTCSTVGLVTSVTDANAPTIGSTVAGSGAAKAMVWCNGANWTVTGK
jgi:hypothetical protein